MATRVPQQPSNLLEQIICDADLDYLGRPDFPEIAGLLKKELLEYGLVKNDHEWKSLQQTFLTKHHYHTQSSILLRQPVKEVNYNSI
jgi:hypothetical protein